MVVLLALAYLLKLKPKPAKGGVHEFDEAGWATEAAKGLEVQHEGQALLSEAPRNIIDAATVTAAKVVHRTHAKDTDESSAADPADNIEVCTLLSLLVLYAVGGLCSFSEARVSGFLGVVVFAVSAAAALLPFATTCYYFRLSKAANHSQNDT